MEIEMTVRDYAELMGVSVRTVTNWVKEGKVKSLKRDGKRWIVVDDAELPKPITAEMRIMELEKAVRSLERAVCKLEEQNHSFRALLKDNEQSLSKIKAIFRKLCKEGG